MSVAPAPIPVPRRKRIKRVLGVAFAGIAVVAVCLVVRYYWGSGAASAQGPAAAQPAATGQSVHKLDVVAVVNGEAVRREELAQMLGGAATPEATRAAADALLDQAESSRAVHA